MVKEEIVFWFIFLITNDSKSTFLFIRVGSQKGSNGEETKRVPKWIKWTLNILVSVFCGSALFSSIVGVRDQGCCPEREAEERNLSFPSNPRAALLAAPTGSMALPSQGHSCCRDGAIKGCQISHCGSRSSCFVSREIYHGTCIWPCCAVYELLSKLTLGGTSVAKVRRQQLTCL